VVAAEVVLYNHHNNHRMEADMDNHNRHHQIWVVVDPESAVVLLLETAVVSPWTARIDLTVYMDMAATSTFLPATMATTHRRRVPTVCTTMPIIRCATILASSRHATVAANTIATIDHTIVVAATATK
jgi:hypothetical protein